MKLTNCRSRLAIAVSAGLLSISLASCGGGDSAPTPSPTPPPANRAPQFTSAADQSVPENISGTVFTLAATDADGDHVTFSIFGGVDASFFTLAGSDLSFDAPPNFEIPSDRNQDNVYEITIAASDGRLTTQQTFAIAVANDFEGIAVTRIASGLDNPVAMARADGSRELVVALKDGRILTLDGETGASSQRQTFDLPVGAEALDVVHRFGENRPNRVVLLWRFGNGINGSLVNTQPTNTTALARGDTAGVRAALAIQPNGRLVAAVGDPGGTRAQNEDRSNGFGALFEEGDPFAGASLRFLAFEKIGKGIQNPGGFANVGDILMLADRGSTVEHEISFFDILARPLNFTWPFFEGSQQLQAGAPSPIIGPSLVYPFGTGSREGEGIVMGALYEGPIETLNDQFVFGDSDGKIWSIAVATLTGGFLRSVADMENRTADFTPDVGSIDEIFDVAVDASGTLYVLDSDGELFRVDQR